eukprot:scaffold17457_cov105-Isochrysis_galbana.AAC.13
MMKLASGTAPTASQFSLGSAWRAEKSEKTETALSSTKRKEPASSSSAGDGAEPGACGPRRIDVGGGRQVVDGGRGGDGGVDETHHSQADGLEQHHEQEGALLRGGRRGGGRGGRGGWKGEGRPAQRHARPRSGGGVYRGAGLADGLAPSPEVRVPTASDGRRCGDPSPRAPPADRASRCHSEAPGAPASGGVWGGAEG